MQSEPESPIEHSAKLPAETILSFVIPLYCEARRVAELIHRIETAVEVLPGIARNACELVIIDDGSEDGTWDTIKQANCRMPIVAIRLSRNFGKEAAILSGLQRARGAAIIVMDGDLQHPPELIPTMVEKWRDEHAQVVHAVKTDRGKEPFLYRLSAGAFNVIAGRLGGLTLKGASDFKLLDRVVVDTLNALPENRTFYRGLVSWIGFEQATVPFRVAPRAGEQRSRWRLKALVSLALTGMTAFTTAPLHFVTVLGVAFMGAAVLLAADTLLTWLRGEAVAGFTTVILLQLIIGSAIMLSLGIVGEYLATTYYEVKARPRYVIAETFERYPNSDDA